MTAFKHAKFIKTALLAKDFPIVRSQSGKILPEIAVAGRSNVGKSSLLNNLFQSKGLVKTSSTPGKTQAINFFIVDDSLSFVDLPGYGYAKVPISVRKEWGPMVQNYLHTRETLKLILFLFDIRRIPNQEDKEFIEWVAKNQKAMILVITKVDKVNQKEKRDNTKNILEALNTENLHHIFYSTTKNVGRKELIRLIDEALEDEKV
jgi:GTP-binding protein